MRKNLMIILMLLTSMAITYGQETTLSVKHQKKLTKITDPYKRKFKYKKYYQKDSLKQVKNQLQ